MLNPTRKEEDTRALAFLCFKFTQPILARGALLSQLPQFLAVIGAYDPPVPQSRRRILNNRVLDQNGQVVQGVPLRRETGQKPAVGTLQRLLDTRKPFNRAAQGYEFTRRNRTERQATHKPLKIGDRSQSVTKASPHIGLLNQIRNRILAHLQRLQPAQGLRQPLAQEAPSHSRNRGINDVQKGPAVAPLSVGRRQQIQILSRGFIKHHVIAGAVIIQPLYVRHAVLLRLVRIGQQGAGRRNSQRLFLASKARQRAHREVLR